MISTMPDGCVPVSDAIVCSPASFPLGRRAKCPTCQRRTRFSGRAQIWYDTRWTCCSCGDSWEGSERAPRPFRRAWRTEAIAGAEAVWSEASRYSPLDYQRWVRSRLEAEV